MNQQKIESLITGLERENKRLKLAAVTMLAATACLLCLAAAPQSKYFASVKAQRLEVVDSKGQTKARLFTDPDGTVALLMSPTVGDECTLQMVAFPDGVGSLIIGRASAAERAIDVYLTNNPEIRCGFHVAGKNGADRIAVTSSTAKGPSIELIDNDGVQRLRASIDKKEDVSRLDLYGGKGSAALAGLGAAADGSSYLTVSQKLPDEEWRCSEIEIYGNAPGGSGVRMTDKDCKNRISLYSIDSGDAKLQFFDSKGYPRLSIGQTGHTGWIDFLGGGSKLRMTMRSTPGSPAKIAWYDENETPIKSIEGKK